MMHVVVRDGEDIGTLQTRVVMLDGQLRTCVVVPLTGKDGKPVELVAPIDGEWSMVEPGGDCAWSAKGTVSRG